MKEERTQRRQVWAFRAHFRVCGRLSADVFPPFFCQLGHHTEDSRLAAFNQNVNVLVSVDKCSTKELFVQTIRLHCTLPFLNSSLLTVQRPCTCLVQVRFGKRDTAAIQHGFYEMLSSHEDVSLVFLRLSRSMLSFSCHMAPDNGQKHDERSRKTYS